MNAIKHKKVPKRVKIVLRFFVLPPSPYLFIIITKLVINIETESIKNILRWLNISFDDHLLSDFERKEIFYLVLL